MPKQPRDIGASVRARLLTLAQQKGQGFQLLLTRYVIERLLYRLSVSPHRDRFVLKGAMLMATWFDDPHRPTRDVDFLGYGDPAPEPMLAVFREVMAVEADDGITFDVAALRGSGGDAQCAQRLEKWGRLLFKRAFDPFTIEAVSEFAAKSLTRPVTIVFDGLACIH